MDSIPEEIEELILQFAHPFPKNNIWQVYSGSDRPRDLRTKSNQERLLRGPLYRFNGQRVRAYKELRLVFPRYYSRALFHTIFVFPHQKSFEKLIALSLSHLRNHVRHIVVALPFFTEALLNRWGCKSSFMRDFWTTIPSNISEIFSRLPNVSEITILPSWDRRSDWIRGDNATLAELKSLLFRPAYGCYVGHAVCMGEDEQAEAINLQSLLSQIRAMKKHINRLNVSNLGAEWIQFLQSQHPDPVELLPLSPATIVHINFSALQEIEQLTVRSCALHDLVWFKPIFKFLKAFHLEDISARHSAEVELFAACLDRRLFPMLESVTIRSSDLLPLDYLPIFGALRNHGSITSFSIEQVHTFCEQGIKFDFVLTSNAFQASPLQAILWQYLKGADIATETIRAEWLQSFQNSGEF